MLKSGGAPAWSVRVSATPARSVPAVRSTQTWERPETSTTATLSALTGTSREATAPAADTVTTVAPAGAPVPTSISVPVTAAGSGVPVMTGMGAVDAVQAKSD